MKNTFSVVIPALNEEKLLPRLLKALASQTYKQFEVILVDAGSEDKTAEIAKSYAKHFPLTIKTVDKKNISYSRNVGASAAKGDYIFFIDADNYIDSSFLKTVKDHTDKGLDLMIPAIFPDSKKLFYKFLCWFVNILIMIGEKLNVNFSTGGNLIIRRASFKEMGGFDEAIFVGEDHDMVVKARKKKLNTAYINKTKVYFSVRRFEKEGAAVFIKYFISTLYIAFFGKITKKIYNYQMGGDYYQKRE